MTVKTQDQPQCFHNPAIKLSSGISVIKIKPVFTFDSKHIIVACGSDIKIFSISSGECVLNFKNHKSEVISIEINKDNKLQIVSCSKDGFVLKWDYTDGTLIAEFNIKLKPLYFCSPPYCKFSYAVVHEKVKEKSGAFSIYLINLMNSNRNIKPYKIIKIMCKYADNCVAFSPNGFCVAVVEGQNLDLYKVERFKIERNKPKNLKRHIRRHKSQIPLTCVVWHPTEMKLATGDEIGRIIVWAGMLDSNHPIRDMYHWHSLSIPDILFSPEGSYIYSGGGEAVLVKWQLNSKANRPQTIPRLGLPICRLAVTDDNSYVAVAHVDNALQILNQSGQIVQSVQGLTKSVVGADIHSGKNKHLRMFYEPRSTSVIVNGRPGHLQFYDVFGGKQLFHLDIVGQNFVSQERERVVINTELTNFAADSKGHWLATLECRDDGETNPEIRLKFWQFDFTSQKFVLNTNVFLPHNKTVNCLKFQPVVSSESSNSEYIPLAVTTSDDTRFKVWTLTSEHASDKKLSWSCERMGYYKDISAGDACFSEDGSLLCIVFDCIITLWTPDTNLLKATLYHPSRMDNVNCVLFGKKNSSHLLVSHTSSTLTVWNIITLSALWNVKCNIQCLVDDPISGVMAAFTEDRNLFVFKPSNVKPVTTLKNVSSTPIISAVFVPLERTKDSCCWQGQSQLYMLNNNQELLTVESAVEGKSKDIVLQKDVPVTPFGLLQAEKTTSDIKKYKQIQHILHGSNREEVLEPMELPCPTYVNTIALCEAVLPSLLKVISKPKPKSTKIDLKVEPASEESSGSEDN